MLTNCADSARRPVEPRLAEIAAILAAAVLRLRYRDPLFLPRSTKLVPVRWIDKHALQRTLYESVTEYVRIGYNQAIKQNRQYLGFLMILMQRLVTSSTYAVASALEKRLEPLQAMNVAHLPPSTDGEGSDDDDRLGVPSLEDSQEQLDELLARRLTGLHRWRNASWWLALPCGCGLSRHASDSQVAPNPQGPRSRQYRGSYRRHHGLSSPSACGSKVSMFHTYSSTERFQVEANTLGISNVVIL